MAETKTMELNVDLGCDRCKKKVKKLLCKYPEIQGQTFNEKENKVTIKVICCNPEKFKSKLIRKGGGTITCIVIKVPPKPPSNPQGKPQENPPAPAPAPAPEKTPEKPPEKTPEKPPAPENTPEKPPAPVPANKPAPENPPAPVPTPVLMYPLICPIGQCCPGHCVGPCHPGCGIPRQPPSYDGYVRLVPSYDGRASGCRCDRSDGCRCEFLIEENPTCTTM